MGTKATHAVAGDPTRLLRRADAPRDLIGWTDGRPLDTLWDECDRGDWLIWLAAIDNIPMVAIVDAAVACAQRAVKSLPKSKERKVLSRALLAAAELESSVLCAKRAHTCEQIADNPDAATYRDAPPTKKRWAAAAVAGAARAAEALLASEARRTAERDHEGRIRGAGIGAGDQIISRGDFPPLVFAPDDELMAMGAHAAETAVAYATRALAPEGANGRQLEKTEGELSEAVFDVLDPVRAGLRDGVPAETLVRAIAIEPYSATDATRERAGDELALLADDKKAMNAVAIGVFFPLGGLGHLHARHTTAGGMLLAAGLVFAGAAIGSIWSPYTWLVIVAADVLMAPNAVRMHNQGTIPKPIFQGTYAAFVIAVAVIVGLKF